MENQIDRQLDCNLIEPLRIERSREQVVAETRGDQREGLAVCGLMVHRDKLSHAGTG